MLLQLRRILYTLSGVANARVTVVSQINGVRRPNGMNSIHSSPSSSLALFQRLQTVERGAVRFEFLVPRRDDNTAIVDRVAAAVAVLDRYRNSRGTRSIAARRSRGWTQCCGSAH